MRHSSSRSTLSVFALLLFILPLHIRGVSAARDQFTHWYPEFGFIFDRIIHDNCSSEHDFYLHGHKNRTYWYDHSRWIGSGTTSELVTPLVNCIMENCPEYVKSNMASATVLLGLAPAILATLGSSVDETGVLAVVGQRPFLALSLAMGSPAVVVFRAFEYRNPLDILDERPGRYPMPSFSLPVECFIILVEYAFTFAAITNVATLGYQLGQNVVLTFAPHLTYLVFLWCFFAPIAHIVSAAALYLRVSSCYSSRRSIRRVQEGEEQYQHDQPLREAEDSGERNANFDYRYRRQRRDPSFYSRVQTFIVGFTPQNRPQKAVLNVETPLFLFLSYALSLLTSAHVMLGVLVFSSMLFISVRDSVALITRFMGSVIVCRIVLMYEVAKLRNLYNMSDNDAADDRLGDYPLGQYQRQEP